MDNFSWPILHTQIIINILFNDFELDVDYAEVHNNYVILKKISVYFYMGQ